MGVYLLGTALLLLVEFVLPGGTRVGSDPIPTLMDGSKRRPNLGLLVASDINVLLDNGAVVELHPVHAHDDEKH